MVRFDATSKTTVSAITSYARIKMNRIKLLILSLGGKIYYICTDSIITDIELPSHLVGDKLGQFKLKYNIKERYFITSKIYCLILDDGQIIKKAKGVFSDFLILDDYKNMLYNNINIKAIKPHTSINYNKGYVNISSKEVRLNFNSYTNR